MKQPLPRRPFRFGVWAEHAAGADALLDTARRAEDAGFSTLLLRDHLVEGPFPHQLAPLTGLATVAARTTRLRVGTMVICNDFRHPAVLAKEVATLDQLSGGRVELGLGAGFLRREYEEAGLRFDEASDRVGRLEESLAVLKGLFAPGPFTHHGRHYRIEGLDAFPLPAQRPHPPILVAGARRRMLAIAAREADVVGIQGVSTTSGDVVDEAGSRSAARVARQVEWVREAAGGRFPGLELSGGATIVEAADPAAAAADLARRRGWEGATADDVLAMPSIFIGRDRDEIAERFHERRERYGLSYFVLSDLGLDAAGPLVSRLTGS